jgi:hypothetical protein
VWNIFKKYPEKIKADKEAALKITDTFWDDTRIFSFDFFRDTFIATDWNTDLLIMLCDSTKEDVQAFAREMITKFFQAQQGTTYLLKLSQHPSTKVQLFTTAYLEQFAADNVEVLTSLKLYFVTLLSQVNKGSVAKKRVFAFLRKEAEKNETIASLAADIFSRVSISMALSERAECIAALRGIQRKFPAIKSPVVLQEYLDYNKNLANAV